MLYLRCLVAAPKPVREAESVAHVDHFVVLTRRYDRAGRVRPR
jgi:hypothetical protein